MNYPGGRKAKGRVREYVVLDGKGTGTQLLNKRNAGKMKLYNITYTQATGEACFSNTELGTGKLFPLARSVQALN